MGAVHSCRQIVLFQHDPKRNGNSWLALQTDTRKLLHVLMSDIVGEFTLAHCCDMQGQSYTVCLLLSSNLLGANLCPDNNGWRQKR